jgi:hypothetical protein
MTEPADKTPGSQGRVLFQRETRREYVRLVDAIDEALAELQQQIREHLPDYMAQRDGGMLRAEWAAAVSNGEQWRIALTVGRVRRRDGAG